MCSLSRTLLVLTVLGFVSSARSFDTGYPKRSPNGTIDPGPDTTKEYESVINVEFDAQGLQAYYDLVLSFIGTVQSEPLPIGKYNTSALFYKCIPDLSSSH